MMKRSILLVVFGMLVAVPVLAEKSLAQQTDFNKEISPGTLTPTPEMWFYQQQQREYQDPKMAVRKRAEYRANQRQRRLAAMRWFGFSNSRPQASSDPLNGDYSPGWSSNDPVHPFRWQAIGQPWIIARPMTYVGRFY
jgi:hypothetical protein